MEVQNQKLLSIGSPHWYFVAILHVSDLDIDQQFIYITLKTSMDYILIIFPQHINILYMLYNGIQKRTTLYGRQKLTSTMMPMLSEYLNILQISL